MKRVNYKIYVVGESCFLYNDQEKKIATFNIPQPRQFNIEAAKIKAQDIGKELNQDINTTIIEDC